MSIKLLLEKAYWHLFKVMPAEMIIKKKWNAFHKIEQLYYGHEFDLGCIRGNVGCDESHSIWFYWNTDLSNAPIIVRKCYEALMRNIPEGWNVRLLTEETAKDYIQLPDFVEQLKNGGEMWYPLYADLIRLALLYKYGGIWCDATCYLTQPIPKCIIEAPLFMFSYDGLLNTLPAKYENWFIRAEKNNYVIKRILQYLLYYWSVPKKSQEYFVWFHLQSALYKHDYKARELMDAMPFFYNYDAMLIHLHYGFEHNYTDKLWEQIQANCFVQKLTHKYNQSIEIMEGNNLLQHIIRSDK